MADVGFAGRLAYVRWLRDRGRVKRLTDAEFAAWLGVGQKWLVKWKPLRNPPKGIAEAEKIDGALRSIGSDRKWLYDGVGNPPEPEEWAPWLADFQMQQGSPALENLGREKERERPASHTAKQQRRR